MGALDPTVLIALGGASGLVAAITAASTFLRDRFKFGKSEDEVGVTVTDKEGRLIITLRSHDDDRTQRVIREIAAICDAADILGDSNPDQAPRAMVDLGVLEREQGNRSQARHWYEQAIATGHPDQAPRAMVGLGVLEKLLGNPGQARHWWEQAIATGHPDQAPRAMVDLGVLEREQGNRSQARHWYEQAIASSRNSSAEGPLSAVRFLTVAEVATILRVSKMDVYRLVHYGGLEAIRVGRSFRVPEAALNDYIRQSIAARPPR